MGSGGEIQQSRVDVSEDVLDDLRDRLARTRWPDQIDGTGWDLGTDRTYLQDLCRTWRDEYDWRKAEATINSFDPQRTEIDGQQVHFLHVRSPEASALPLVVTHGWPGSIAEFLDVIGPLADPAAHGGDPADAFHVVVPSLPGYGFSGPTTERGWDSRRVGRAWAELMARLGYDRYGAQGGDWGSMVSTQIALVDPEHVAGIHINLVIAGPPEGDDMSDLTPEEGAALASAAAYIEEGSGYARIQSTRPQSLSYGLNDSPAGLAGWIVEKFRDWSDCDGDVERSFTRDQLLTNLTVYWATGTAGSSARLYMETTRAGRFGLAGERVEVPTGCALFPKEIIRPPRKWAEAAYNVVHWSEMPRGGHFAAMEEPELFVDDVRAFFRGVR